MSKNNKNNNFNFIFVLFADIFYTDVTADKKCELRIKNAKLDHEHEDEFKLKIRLDTLAGLVNPAKSIANVSVSSYFKNFMGNIFLIFL